MNLTTGKGGLWDISEARALRERRLPRAVFTDADPNFGPITAD
jgi:hypothetical protein